MKRQQLAGTLHEPTRGSGGRFTAAGTYPCTYYRGTKVVCAPNLASRLRGPHRLRGSLQPLQALNQLPDDDSSLAIPADYRRMAQLLVRPLSRCLNGTLKFAETARL